MPVLRGVAGRLVRAFFAQALNSLLMPSALLFLLLLFSIVLRRRWLAAAALSLFFPVFALQSDYPQLDVPLARLCGVAYLFILIRFGLLPFVFTQFYGLAFNFFSVTPDLSAWYAGGTLFALAVSVALLAFGFHTSLAGQKLLSGSLVED